MKKSNKKTKVRDMKPSKDAKGGGGGIKLTGGTAPSGHTVPTGGTAPTGGGIRNN